jgi:hypothetical protein
MTFDSTTGSTHLEEIAPEDLADESSDTDESFEELPVLN